MTVRPVGEDIAKALRGWISDEITEAPKRIFELAKFLFGVSSGSIGVLVTVSNFSKNSWSLYEWGALIAFVASAAIALCLALPRIHRLHANFDLANAHGQLVLQVWWLSLVWGASWIAALILAGFGLAEGNPPMTNCISGI